MKKWWIFNYGLDDLGNIAIAFVTLDMIRVEMSWSRNGRRPWGEAFWDPASIMESWWCLSLPAIKHCKSLELSSGRPWRVFSNPIVRSSKTFLATNLHLYGNSIYGPIISHDFFGYFHEFLHFAGFLPWHSDDLREPALRTWALEILQRLQFLCWTTLVIPSLGGN